jgi:hypothetical protein
MSLDPVTELCAVSCPIRLTAHRPEGPAVNQTGLEPRFLLFLRWKLACPLPRAGLSSRP